MRSFFFGTSEMIPPTNRMFATNEPQVVDARRSTDYAEATVNTVQTGIGLGMISLLGKRLPLPECRRTEMIKSFADKKLKALWGLLRNSSRIHGGEKK